MEVSGFSGAPREIASSAGENVSRGEMPSITMIAAAFIAVNSIAADSRRTGDDQIVHCPLTNVR